MKINETIYFLMHFFIGKNFIEKKNNFILNPSIINTRRKADNYINTYK